MTRGCQLAFTVPVFPLSCAIFTAPWAASHLHRLVSPCNLAPGRRVYLLPVGEDAQDFIATVATILLLPAGTDVRDWSCGAPGPDSIECPAGSGRWYCVQSVDDAGKGFDNEHRVVLMSKIFEVLNGTNYPGLNWPIPIP